MKNWKDILAADEDSEEYMALEKEVDYRVGKNGNRERDALVYQEVAFYLTRIYKVKDILEYVKGSDLIRFHGSLFPTPNNISIETDQLKKADLINDIVLCLKGHDDTGQYVCHNISFNQIYRARYQAGKFIIPPREIPLSVLSIEPTPIPEGLLPL